MGRLGSSWGPGNAPNTTPADVSCKFTFWKKSGVKKRLGSILSRSWVDFWGQKGPKRHQKRDQNDIKILIDFWIDFGSICRKSVAARGRHVGGTWVARRWLRVPRSYSSNSSKNSPRLQTPQLLTTTLSFNTPWRPQGARRIVRALRATTAATLCVRPL